MSGEIIHSFGEVPPSARGIDPDFFINSPSSALLNTLVEDQVEAILSKAVASIDYTDKPLTPLRAYAAIAQIASLRRLPRALVARQKSHQ